MPRFISTSMLSLFSQNPSSKSNNYLLQATLSGHLGSIACLGVTDDGKLLASGGTDGTKVWDLETMRRIRSPSNAGVRGASTTLTWIQREDEPGEAFFYGTQNSFLAIAFGAISGNERDILTFGLYNGHIHTLCGGTGDIAETWNVGGYMAIVCGSDHGVVYVFDRRSGDTLDELRIDTNGWVQTITTTDCNGVSTILAAKSREIGGPNEIFVWRKRTEKRRFTAGVSWSMMTIVHVVMVIATVAFLYQNMMLGKLVGGKLGRF
ncbi:hypothetical protein B0H10DRAFT_1941947 [Mycena sp. CBHHK59/15]|nr:hypothetical protein B0H10DRAFT_1941947 [Mycena sp. CBHHK59/15]